MQSLQDRQAADARVNALFVGWINKVAVIGAALTIIGAVALLLVAFETTSETGVRALKTDYRVFWGAARLALEGDFLGPFDIDRLAAVHNVNPEEWMPWLYPPGYLFVIMPLGAFSYAVSFLIATVISVVLLTWAVRTFTAGSVFALFAFALAPAYMPALILGQNSLVWFAGLLAALAALRQERWILAGIFIGILTLKPHLGLMIPFALLAAGYWRTILAATVTAIVIAVVPTFVTGFAYWPLFLERLGDQGDMVRQSITTLHLMVGTLRMMVLAGIDRDFAFLAQFGFMGISALLVLLVWRSKTVGFDAKVATLLAAMFLSAPYMWYYDATVMALLGLFLVRAGILQRKWPDLLLLFVLWMGGGARASAIFVPGVLQDIPWSFITAPAVLISFGLCLSHYLGSRRVTVTA